jgi:hypothetical protein
MSRDHNVIVWCLSCVAHGVPKPTDWAVDGAETFLCKLCRSCGVVRTERTLDDGVSPLVKGALSLLMSPFVVDSSACGDMKSCDVLVVVV